MFIMSSSSIDWTKLVKDRKGIRTKDNISCGNIIGNDEKNIIIENGYNNDVSIRNERNCCTF
jgi:hypothetical protein